jgi:hypothetical protein
MSRHAGLGRVRCSLAAAACAVLLGGIAQATNALAATLHIALTPVQHTPTSVVRVIATGSADAAPTACPPGIGCELTVFVIRQGSCPAQAAALLGDPDIVVFLTKAGLPALIGTTPGPFAVSSDYFLDGAPTAAGQGNADDGYTASAWGTFTFCGYLQDATAVSSFTNPPPDQLAPAGPPRVRLNAGPLSVYSATCAALPCRIVLRERAFARSRHLAVLDRRDLGSVLDGAAPAGGFPVSFPIRGPMRAALTRAIARFGAVSLRFTATVIDADGGRVTAARRLIVSR